MAALRSMQAYYGFTADDVNLAVAPLTHGSSHYVLPVLAVGGAHVLMAQPDRAAMLDELKHRVTVAFMPPTLIYLLMEEAAFGPGDFTALRHLTWSAAPMPPARIEQAVARFGPVLGALFGQTEAPMTIAALTPEQVARPELRGAAGYPFPDTPVRVLTAGGDVADQGEGEILVGGDLADTAYLDDPDATDEARQDGWLRTGDLGRLEADGLLTILGRSREMIISGGYNIYPAEVEAALGAHPAVREACASAWRTRCGANGWRPPWPTIPPLPTRPPSSTMCAGPSARCAPPRRCIRWPPCPAIRWARWCAGM